MKPHDELRRDRHEPSCPDSVDLTFSPASRLFRALRGHVRVTGFGMCVLALGLLIWARLMLVTNHPRVAVADPALTLPVQSAAAIDPAHTPEPEPHPTALAAQGD